MVVLREKSNKPALWLGFTSLALYVGVGWIVTGPPDTREWLLGYAMAWSLYLGLFLMARDEDFVASPWVLIAWALLSRLALVQSTVWLSDDLYRYLLDGRVLAEGVNPYRFAPAHPEIAAIAGDLAAKVNHPEVPTIYPPIVQALGWLAAQVPLGVEGWRVLVSLIDVGAMILVARMFGGSDRAWKAAAVYGLCPLAVWEAGANGHLEPIAALPLVLAVTSMYKGHPIRAGLALGAAALVKLYALLLIPLWLRDRGFKRMSLVSLLVVATAVWPFTWHGVDVLGGLRTYLAHWSFNSPLHATLSAITGDSPVLRVLPFVVIGVAGIVAGWKREDPVRTIPTLLFAFLVIGPTLHPWYALWLLPWLGDRPHPGHWSFVAAMGGAYAVWWSVATTGVWELPHLVPEALWSIVALGWLASFWRDEGSTPEPV